MEKKKERYQPLTAQLHESEKSIWPYIRLHIRIHIILLEDRRIYSIPLSINEDSLNDELRNVMGPLKRWEM